MDEIKLKNRCISSPGLRIKGGSASPLVNYANTFAFYANGLVSPSVTTADAPSLALATTNTPNAVVAGNLLSDNGSVNTGIKCVRIYTLVATLPANDGSTAPTFSWLAGPDFTKYEFPSTQYVALPNKYNQAVVGYVIVKNAGAVDFVPGTTNLDAANVTTTFVENSVQLGTGSALGSAHIFVGNGSGAAADVALSGDATLANTGAITIAAQAVTASKIANATITRTQMSADAGLTSIQTKLGDIATTGTFDTYVRVSKPGTISAINMMFDTNLAASDTNYITFTATNLTGTKVLLNASGANNTTKVTGGTAITAETARAMNLTATGTDLVVAAGDWIRVTATVTGTLANTVVQNNVCIDMTGTS